MAPNLHILEEKSECFFVYCFNKNLLSPQPTLGHSQEGTLLFWCQSLWFIHFTIFNFRVTKSLVIKVWYLTLANHTLGFESATFWF